MLSMVVDAEYSESFTANQLLPQNIRPSKLTPYTVYCTYVFVLITEVNIGINSICVNAYDHIESILLKYRANHDYKYRYQNISTWNMQSLQSI